MSTLAEINARNCCEPLELHPAARQAFADRQAKLVEKYDWPNAHWYNDEDFCRAYNTACLMADECARLQKELHRSKIAELCDCDSFSENVADHDEGCTVRHVMED